MRFAGQLTLAFYVAVGAIAALLAMGRDADAQTTFAYVCRVTPTSTAGAASSACGNGASDAAIPAAEVLPSHYVAACADNAASCDWNGAIAWRRFDAVASSALMWATSSSNENGSGAFVRKDALFGAPPPPPPPSPPPPPTVTGTSMLAWTPPTTNTDGSPLTNLSGYRVYWGLSATSFSSSASIGDPNLTAWIVEGLTPGTWFFAVTALAGGAESAFSNVASKTIEGEPVPPPPPPPAPAVPRVIAVVSGLSHSPVFGVTSAGARSSTVVGFALVGTECVGAPVFTYRSRSYYRLLGPSAVVWWGTNPTAAAAVACATN